MERCNFRHFGLRFCAKLGIANPSDAAGRLDSDEKSALGIADPHGRIQRTTIINESGLYSVIIRSRVPKAKAFQKWVTSEVLPSIRKTGGYRGKVPAFIRRYSENWDRVSAGHFSVLSELVVHLWGRFEMAGHIMADRSPDGTENRPDGSAGRVFSDWLKKNHPTVSAAFSYYMHKTPEWEGEVRQYSAKIPERQSRTLHFAKLHHGQKLAAVQTIAGKPLRALSVVAAKEPIPPDIYVEKNQLYFYMTRYLKVTAEWQSRSLVGAACSTMSFELT